MRAGASGSAPSRRCSSRKTARHLGANPNPNPDPNLNPNPNPNPNPSPNPHPHLNPTPNQAPSRRRSCYGASTSTRSSRASRSARSATPSSTRRRARCPSSSAAPATTSSTRPACTSGSTRARSQTARYARAPSDAVAVLGRDLVDAARGGPPGAHDARGGGARAALGLSALPYKVYPCVARYILAPTRVTVVVCSLSKSVTDCSVYGRRSRVLCESAKVRDGFITLYALAL